MKKIDFQGIQEKNRIKDQQQTGLSECIYSSAGFGHLRPISRQNNIMHSLLKYKKKKDKFGHVISIVLKIVVEN